MASNNIYDIAISELIARNDTGGVAGSTTESIQITINIGPLIGLNIIVPNPINVISSVTNILDGWVIVPNSHKIFISVFGSAFQPQIPVGSASILDIDDGFNGTTSALPDEDVRKYYSEIVLEQVSSPGTFRTITSSTISVITVTSIYFGFNTFVPSDVSDLSDSVLKGTSELKIDSNNIFDDFYIAIPSTEPQPAAIADEHGNISDISEYPEEVGAIVGFITYRYKWPIKFTGDYLHTFTLIYS